VVPAIQADRVRVPCGRDRIQGHETSQLARSCSSGDGPVRSSSHARRAGQPQKLRSVYQRVHFSQQYPPEAAQFIQANCRTPKIRCRCSRIWPAISDPKSASWWPCSSANSALPTAAKFSGNLSGMIRNPSAWERRPDSSGWHTRPASRSRPRRCKTNVLKCVALRRRTLAALADKTAESALIEALQDDNEMVRVEVTGALSVCGSINAVPSLINRMQDRSVRFDKG